MTRARPSGITTLCVTCLLLACQQQEVRRQPIQSGLDTTLVHQRISYRVVCANPSSLDTVHVTPAGLDRERQQSAGARPSMGR